jgi:uncharacterized protein (UPF0335 family)
MSQPNATEEQLRHLIERIERLEEEKKGISDDIRDVYNEAKATGYDTKVMRLIVRLRTAPTTAAKWKASPTSTRTRWGSTDHGRSPLDAVHPIGCACRACAPSPPTGTAPASIRAPRALVLLPR